jgi:hypothetical protein
VTGDWLLPAGISCFVPHERDGELLAVDALKQILVP